MRRAVKRANHLWLIWRF